MKTPIALALFGLTFAPSSFAREYRQILHCDNGSAVVDVDLDQPRIAQVVIRDYHALDYLKSKGIVRDLDLSHRDWNNQSKPYELILVGEQGGRVTEEGFRGIRGNRSENRLQVVDAFGPYQRHAYVAFAYPEAGGLKLRIDEEIHAYSGCDVRPTITGNGSECIGGRYVNFPAESFPNRAEWFFPNCR